MAASLPDIYFNPPLKLIYMKPSCVWIFLNLKFILLAIGTSMSALLELMVLLSGAWASWQLLVPLPLDNRIQLAANLSPVIAIWSFLL